MKPQLKLSLITFGILMTSTLFAQIPRSGNQAAVQSNKPVIAA